MWPFSSSSTYPELSPEDVGVEIAPGDVASTSAASSDERGVYDYIVVGGGTGGCVLANRLSEDPDVTVLLLERGQVADTWIGRVPLISTNFARRDSPNYEWNPIPQKEMQTDDSHADFKMITGKALGGTSRINSMLYTRGGPEYNAWEKMGRKGWSYDEMHPYFLKSQAALGSLAHRPHHGTQGYWQTRSYACYYLPTYERTIEAASTLGLPFIPDINALQRPPFGCADLDVTIDAQGQRCSTYHAFLPVHVANERRGRLKIATSTIVSRIVFEEGEGEKQPRAVGVVIEPEDGGRAGRKYLVRARREIVLCSGAIGSPYLLQLSGVGPADHLREKGVKVVKDLPGVGSNLQDHFGASVQYSIPIYDSLHALQEKPLVVLREILKYVLFGWGIFLAPIVQISIFARSDLLSDDGVFLSEQVTSSDPNDPANVPDIEIMPIANSCTNIGPTDGRGSLSFLTVLAQPKSRGTVRLLTTDPRDRPACNLGYFSSEEDWATMRKGMRLSLAMGEQMRKRGYEIEDFRVLRKDAGEEEFRTFVKRQARTTYHYSSTCRMAPEDDPQPGVVDDELRVHGIRGLRIADASIFPNILSTHLQAPVVAVAEKCADMIKATYRAESVI